MFVSNYWPCSGLSISNRNDCSGNCGNNGFLLGRQVDYVYPESCQSDY